MNTKRDKILALNFAELHILETALLEMKDRGFKEKMQDEINDILQRIAELKTMNQ